MKTSQRKIKKTYISLSRFLTKTSLPEVAFITSFIISRYLLNADFQYPSEIIIPIIFFGFIATVAFYIYRLLLGSWFAARIATLPFIYALFSYSYIPGWMRKFGDVLLPGSLQTSFASAIVTVVFVAILSGALGYGTAKLVCKVKFIQNLQLHKIVLFAVLFIFATQFLKTANKLFEIRNQLNYSYKSPSFKQDSSAILAKPDIYYFVFDRYGSTTTLKNIYNYDNSGLTDYLSSQGFVNRLDAYANYPFTMSSVSSTLAMQYHTGLSKLFSKDKLHTGFPYRSILNNPPIAQVLRENGYRYNQVSSWWDFTRVGIHADEHPTEFFRLRAFGKNFYLSDLTRDILNKSIMKPWLNKGITSGSTIFIKYDNDGNPQQNFSSQKRAIKAIAGSRHSSPQFTFAHVLVPHTPYVFDADGSYPDYDDGQNDVGVDESVKYINSVKFINTQIKEMMGYIREKSPNAAIIIQADEGPYPKQFRYGLTPTHYYDPATLPLDQEKQKFSILASYYMPGVDAQVVKENITASVNPFRFILKHYLGYDMDMLPDCNFSTGNKFTAYTFTNETAKLQQNPSAACDNL